MVLALAALASGCKRSRSTDGAGASPEAAPGTSLVSLNLPVARNGRSLPEGEPRVWVAGDQVLCDGVPVGKATDIVKAGHPLRIDGLMDALRRARDASAAEVVVIAFDADAPSTVVKSVVQTAGFAGFPHAELVARGADGAARVLDVETIVPMPNAAPEPPVSVRVVVRRGAWALVWADGSGAVSSSGSGSGSGSSADGGSFADLYDVVPRESAAHAPEKAEAGLVQSIGLVHMAYEATYADLAAAIDALLPSLPVTLSLLPPTPGVHAGTLAAPDGGAGTGGAGRLPPETIQRVLRQNFGAFRLCYQHAAQNDLSLTGTVRVRFSIEPDGGVTHAAVDRGSTLTQSALVACLAGRLSRIQFPAPQGGRMDLVVPLTFTPDDTTTASDDQRIGPGLY